MIVMRGYCTGWISGGRRVEVRGLGRILEGGRDLEGR